jgi:deoxyribodipyrimidine photolyase
LKTLNLISIKNCPKNKLKKEIVIVWFKRDLRFTDHEALFYAHKQSLPILLIY